MAPKKTVESCTHEELSYHPVGQPKDVALDGIGECAWYFSAFRSYQIACLHDRLRGWQLEAVPQFIIYFDGPTDVELSKAWAAKLS